MSIDERLDKSIELAERIVPDLEVLREKSGSLEMYYNELHQFADNMIESSNIKQFIQCGRQQCSFCCHDKIMGPLSEIVYISNLVKKKGIKVNKSVIQTEENWNTLTFKEKACPLLDEDGRCSIYENRPLICRAHNISLGEDIEKCKRLNGETTRELVVVSVESLQFADIMRDGSLACLNFHLLK
jgi:Fe-S-cluster containining protein